MVEAVADRERSPVGVDEVDLTCILGALSDHGKGDRRPVRQLVQLRDDRGGAREEELVVFPSSRGEVVAFFVEAANALGPRKVGVSESRADATGAAKVSRVREEAVAQVDLSLIHI